MVRDRSGGARAAFPLPPGGGFSITYRHSVTREPATEFFRVGKGFAIVLVGTEFGGSGAGLPFTDEGGSATIRDGKVVIEGMQRSFERIWILPLPLTGHRLGVGGREHDLLALIGGSGPAVLAIERCGGACLQAALIRGFR